MIPTRLKSHTTRTTRVHVPVYSSSTGWISTEFVGSASGSASGGRSGYPPQYGTAKTSPTGKWAIPAVGNNLDSIFGALCGGNHQHKWEEDDKKN
ncbi:hypothetical protein SDJN03_06105, partial [Cucurbita argyrosperma subsp. sororia]